MIALHACDIATDYAIDYGLRAGASVILCSPCCHKEVRPQMTMPALLRPVLQHGVHLGQEAEMVTDGLRALLLDAEGYDTQVFEFISLEGTSRNLPCSPEPGLRLHKSSAGEQLMSAARRCPHRRGTPRRVFSPHAGCADAPALLTSHTSRRAL